jgi:hypothetical protein
MAIVIHLVSLIFNGGIKLFTIKQVYPIKAIKKLLNFINYEKCI